jgi:hypothetical protein
VPDDDADEAPSLELDAPRKARARAKSIPIELTANDAGRVQLSLLRANRVVARASIRLDADGTADHRLKIPKGAKAGTYTLKATYKTATVAQRITLTGKATARRSTATSVTLSRGPVALPDGRFHGELPARTFKVR